MPSKYLADQCRENAPEAEVHETTLEDFETDEKFDLCLFSESFQYIPLKDSLKGAMALLKPGGEVLIADCFRKPGWKGADGPVAGGGHPVAKFDKALARSGLRELVRRDITEAVAPSIDLEQGLFNVIGHVLAQIDAELAGKRPALRWSLNRLVGLFLRGRSRDRLATRLMARTRTAEVFCQYNLYQIVRLKAPE